MNFFYTLFLVALSATPFLPTITAHSNKDYLPSQTSFLRLLQKSAIPAYSGRYSIPTNMAYCPYGIDLVMAPLQHALSDFGKDVLQSVYTVVSERNETEIEIVNVRGRKEKGSTFTAEAAIVMRLNEEFQTNLRGAASNMDAVKIEDDASTVGDLTPSQFELFKHTDALGMKKYFLKFGKEQKVEQVVNRWISSTTNGMILGNEKFEDTNKRLSIISVVYFAAGWMDKLDVEYGTFMTIDKDINHVVEYTVKYATYFGTFYGAKLWKSEKDNVQILSLPFNDDTFRLNLIYPSDGNVVAFLQNLEEDKIDIEGIKKERHYKYNHFCTHDIKFPVFKLDNEVPLQHALKEKSVNDIISNSLYDLLGDKQKEVYFKQKMVIRVDELGAEAAAVTGFDAVDGIGAKVTAHVETAFMFQIEYDNKIDSAILYQGIITDIIDAQKDMLH